MTATEEFVAQCLTAVTGDRETGAVKELVERAVRDKQLCDELVHEAPGRLLYRDEGITIVHVVMPKDTATTANPIPHDHLMWAVIGVMVGAEENEFFRRSANTIQPSGAGLALSEGDVTVMGREVIHSVRNPSSSQVSSSLHVYGGDLVAAAKSMWCEPDFVQEPFDSDRVFGFTRAGTT